MTVKAGASRGCKLVAALVAAMVCFSAAAATTRPAATRPSTRPATTSGLGQTLIQPATRTPDGSSSTQSVAAAPVAQGMQLPRVLGALALVIGLIFVLRSVFRRSMGAGAMTNSSAVVQVLTRCLISPRQQLVLLRVGRRLIVAADCNGQLSALSEITDPDEVATLVGELRDEKLSAASKSFGGLLGCFRRGMSDESDVDEEPVHSPRLRRDAAGEVDGDEAEDPAVAATRQDISGLLERVRLLSHQFKI